MSTAKNGPPTLESLPYVEALWQAYQAGQDVPSTWRDYFERWRFGESPSAGSPAPTVAAGFFQSQADGDGVAAPHMRPARSGRPANRGRESIAEDSISNGQSKPAIDSRPRPSVSENTVGDSRPAAKKHRADLSIDVRRLIGAYRQWGHLAARLDPLGRERPAAPELDPASYGLLDSQQSSNRLAATGGNGQPQRPAIEDVVSRYRNIYCSTIGYQYLHVPDRAARLWLRQRIESHEPPLHRREQLRILNRLTAADGLEQFTRKKYVGAKTFSLAGSETLIPLLDAVIEHAADDAVFEIVLAMAHRGRLNVLINILGQRPRDIFRELEDQDGGRRLSSGDVRYHLGYSNDWLSQHGDRMHLSLSFNPSHLEFVNPVALGRMRAKQQRAGDAGRKRGLTVLLHGDAAFIGEGVVQESLNLARLPGYTTGGTVHIVIDNQLGFTTDPSEARSTTYSSDIALAFGAPIFHVNGDDPEAAVRIARLAIDFRQRFCRDVVINLHCFRRFGHNEADEPAFTQPRMYELIESHPSVWELYSRRLEETGRVTADASRRMQEQYAARLQAELEAAGHTRSTPRTPSLGGVWSGYVGGPEPSFDQPVTGVDAEKLRPWLAKLITVPDGFHLHHKLAQGLARRQEMIEGRRPLDWATCELLALASLAMEGRPVRLTGQDTARGTFSQRHAVWHDVETGATYMPLANLAAAQAPVEVINSPLCEAGALGFEYGYSLDYPEALVAWEAQFGDFWNAAQVIFDQFVASAEDKWSRLSGLVLLLPHGFEGQGPEHSSARLERFLVSAAADNFQVVVPSTPAQYFHCLRRQALRRWRKPLVILTPKSLLRHHEVVSTWDDLQSGSFSPVIEDTRDRTDPVRKVLLCTGKLYYDLLKGLQERGARDIALIRIEQFYPWPALAVQKALAAFDKRTPVVWCQEEPANMGAHWYVRTVWPLTAPDRGALLVVTRPASASPATGSHAAHKSEQQQLVEQALE